MVSKRWSSSPLSGTKHEKHLFSFSFYCTYVRVSTFPFLFRVQRKLGLERGGFYLCAANKKAFERSWTFASFRAALRVNCSTSRAFEKFETRNVKRDAARFSETLRGASRTAKPDLVRLSKREKKSCYFSRSWANFTPEIVASPLTLLNFQGPQRWKCRKETLKRRFLACFALWTRGAVHFPGLKTDKPIGKLCFRHFGDILVISTETQCWI